MLLGGCVVTAALLAGCSDSPTPVPNPTSPAPTSLPTSTVAGDAPSATASRAPDPTAPATIKPLDRPGAASKRIAVDTDALRKATWADGVTLQVVSTTQGTTGGRGAGSLPGSPMTTFELSLHNGSKDPVDVSAVVLTVTYGSSRRLLAQPVYDADSRDFTGTVEAGKTTTATYQFVIPTAQLGHVGVAVDLDGRHALARLDGSAR